METTFMSHVARRKLNFQQLENALGRHCETRNLLKAATTRWGCGQVAVTTRTTSCEHWCGWITLRCDLEQVDKAARPYRHISLTRKWMHRQSFQVPRFGHNQVWTDRTGTRFSTHCKRTSTIAIPGIFCNYDDGQETIEDNEVPQISLQARPAFQHPGYRAVREDLNVAQKSRGFFGPRRGASGRDQGPHMKRSSIQQLILRTRCRKLGHWARECPERNRGQRNDERYGRRAVRPLGASWTFVTLDPGEFLWDTGAV